MLQPQMPTAPCTGTGAAGGGVESGEVLVTGLQPLDLDTAVCGRFIGSSLSASDRNCMRLSNRLKC